MINGLAELIFRLRTVILILFAIVTVTMAYFAIQLRPNAAYEKQLPVNHPYIQTLEEYRESTSSGNRVIVVLREREGDIYNPDFFQKLKEVTDELFYLPAVDRRTVTSLWTPNVRYMEITEEGFRAEDVIPARFTNDEKGITLVRDNIRKAALVGRLVGKNHQSAMVRAELLDYNFKTGEQTDYFAVAAQLEDRIRDKFQSDELDVHIIGFAKQIGDVADGALDVIRFFVVALFITAILVYLYSHSWRLTILPLICSLVAVIWQFGLLTMLGYGLDPMSILVPFLVFAIGVSHGVQMINAVGGFSAQGIVGMDAAKEAFKRLLVPGGAALITDTVGFMTLYIIAIRMIRELSVTASLGVAVIILTNLLLLPLLLSYVKLDDKFREKARKSAERRDRLWRAMAGLARPTAASVAIVLGIVLAGVGWYYGKDLPIGDLHAGAPELRADHQYNRDTRMVVDRFDIGVDVMIVIAEWPDQACINYDHMRTLQKFEWAMRNVPGVQFTESLATSSVIGTAGWAEGNLKFRNLARNPSAMSQSIRQIDSASGLLNADCTVMPLFIYTDDHKATTIDRVIERIEQFKAEHETEEITFRLASGNVGVMAAINQAVSAAQIPMMGYVYAAIILLCYLAFRSVRGTICVILPLMLASVLGYAVMTLLEIGLKVATLPVMALAVGIGVDYGLYIFSRFQVYLDQGWTLSDSYLQTMRETGSAVLFTGATLAVGVSTWVFSDLKFQSDMGMLLMFMFLVNMLGAIILIPSIAVAINAVFPWKPKAGAVTAGAEAKA